MAYGYSHVRGRYGAAIGAGGASPGPENFRMDQVVPGATPLTVTSWPDEQTQDGNTVTVRSSPTLSPWVPTVIGSFPVSTAMYNAKSFGGALNTILATLSGTEIVQVQIGSRYSYLTQRGNATPSFTSSSTIGIAEGVTLSFPVTTAAPARSIVIYSGADMLNYELVGGNLRFWGNATGDYELGATQTFALGALGYNGKWGFQTITVTLTDVDELPATPTFTTVTGAALSGSTTFTWTVTGIDTAGTGPFAFTGVTAVRQNGVNRPSLGGTYAYGDVIAFDVPHSGSYSTPSVAALAAGGVAQGGTVNATATAITLDDPNLVATSISSSGCQWNGSIFAGTVDFNYAFTTGRWLIFTCGRTSPVSIDVASNGTAAFLDKSGGYDEGAQAWDITIATPGTLVCTLTKDSGGGAPLLYRNGMVGVKITNTLIGNNGTVVKSFGYNNTQTCTSGLTILTNGVGITAFYFEMDMTAAGVSIAANVGTIFAQYNLAGGYTLVLVKHIVSETPSVTVTQPSGNAPGSAVGVSIKKGALA